MKDLIMCYISTDVCSGFRNILGRSGKSAPSPVTHNLILEQGRGSAALSVVIDCSLPYRRVDLMHISLFCSAPDVILVDGKCFVFSPNLRYCYKSGTVVFMKESLLNEVSCSVLVLHRTKSLYRCD